MKSLKTYLVEDSAVIRDNLTATLEELTSVHVLGSADNETEGVHWLQKTGHAVELVIVDLFLKSGSGLGVLRALTGLTHPVHRVVLTNYASDEIRRRCLELGAHHVFDKSNDIDALIQYCRGLAGCPATSFGTPSH